MKWRSLLRTCSDCHVTFPRLLAGLLVFDSDKGAYVCQQSVKGYGSKNMRYQSERFTTHPRTILKILFILTWLLMPGLIFGVYDIGRARSWDSLDVTTVEDLPDSGTVKLEGVINESADSIVIGIHETNPESGYSFDYDHDGGFFQFSDDTGTVNVSWEHWYEIQNGKHIERTEHRAKGYVYKGGDTIFIIGVVEEGSGGEDKEENAEGEEGGDGEGENDGMGDEGGNGGDDDESEEQGTKRINALYIAPEEQEIKRSGLLYAIVISFLLPYIIGYGWVLRTTIQQNKSHLKFMEQRSSMESKPPPVTNTGIYGPGEQFDHSNIIWHPNSRYISPSAYIALVLGICLVVFGLIYWLLNNHHTRLDLFQISTFYPVFSMLGLWLISMSKPLGYSKLQKVGISGKGIHFFSPNPFVQLSIRGFVPWEDVKFIGVEPRNSNWVISLGNSDNVTITNVRRRLRKILISEWKERKPISVRRKERFQMRRTK